MAQVLDYSGGFPGALNIVRAGYVGAVRYIGFPDRRKCTSRAEFEDFSRHGLGMALVYEDSATNWRSGYNQGQLDAQRARLHADQIRFPADRPIYMAIDQQVLTDSEHASAVGYIRGAASVLGAALTGVYGQYSVMQVVAANRACDWFWQCRAWSGTPPKLFGERHLYQRVGTVNVGGIACDINDILAPDWGQHNAGGGDMSAEDVAQYMRITIRKGPDGVDRNLEDTLFQMSAWVGETLNTVKPLSDDEANLLDALRRQTTGSVDIADLSARLTASLGPAIATELGRRLLEGNPA